MNDQDSAVYISLEFTPNPNTLKYSVNRQLLDKGAVNFTSPKDAEARSPLAFRLFSIAGICGVMIGKDFVTVTKTEDGDWDVVHKGTSAQIQEHLTQGLPVLNPEVIQNEHKGGQSAIEDRIRQILDDEIRPAVAMDGGDITFEKYEDGVVYLFLQGSCSGCPSSTATLKDGIERRLQEVIPEIKEVISV